MTAPQTPSVGKALQCVCPKCGQGPLYKHKWSLSLNPSCPACGYDFSANDSADGPAVFLIFVLGFTVVPAALYVEFTFEPPVWVHILLWGPAVFGLTIALLRPVKSYVMALQYNHRESNKDSK